LRGVVPCRVTGLRVDVVVDDVVIYGSVETVTRQERVAMNPG
jgi:hypothetical protein